LEKISNNLDNPLFITYHSTLHFYNNGKWGYILKLYDKNMINLLVNIPDNNSLFTIIRGRGFLNILK